ncbi:MAG: hypothetical protein E7617_02460 [Ruminococcaceae bacterium]|nr:hypothetical protein [Oscillospiraceae bacterium]
MDKTLKINFKKSLGISSEDISHEYDPVAFFVISIISIIPFMLKLYGYTLNIIQYGLHTTFSDVLGFAASALIICCLMLFPNNLEFFVIPIAIISLQSLVGLNSLLSVINLILNALFLAALICFLLEKIDHKMLKKAAYIYAAARVALIAFSLIKILIAGNKPDIKSYLFSISLALIISLPIALSHEKENAEPIKIPPVRIIIAIIILIVTLLLVLIFPSIDFKSAFGPSGCGHPGCEENGPFPCYGKNNTCPNTTDCYQDLYCDECD